MARVAVVGTGAVGGYFASRAHLAGNDLQLCVRTPYDRLVVDSRGARTSVDGRVVTDPAEAEPADLVMLATKSYDVGSAAAWLAALSSGSTIVAVLQNGVEHEARTRPHVSASQPIVPTVVYCGGECPKPGYVIHRSHGFVYAPDGPPARAFADILDDQSGVVRLTEDFTTVAWRKLCVNVAANSVTALTGLRSPVFRDARVTDLVEGLVAECAAVGRLEGAALRADVPKEVVQDLQGLPDEAGSSMLYDRLAGRPLEHEALNGAVVRLGARHGVPTPLNRAVDVLLGAISSHAAAGGGDRSS